jgi:flavin reductase (DIM6/NTAB) family NADH-FMN oxidoreductase RutF
VPAPDVQSHFNKLVNQLDYSMLVVTATGGGERAGCLVGFATQVSIKPPRFLVCLSVKNRTYRVARGARVLVVHFVTEDDVRWAKLFGGETGDEVDKFARCRWRPGPDDAPVVEEFENWFAGRVLEHFDFGDHHGYLLEPIEGEAGSGEAPLTFHRAKRIEPGHEP